MIGTIRRHTKWLWWFIIVATISTFVFYLSPSQRMGGGGGLRDASNPDLGSINGEPVTLEQLRAAKREAVLFYYFRTGNWPESADQSKQITQIAQQELVVQSILKDYKIVATTDAAARFTRENILHVPADQAFPADQFNSWVVNQLKGRAGLSLDDFDHYVRHQAASDYLVSLFGMSGKLVTPKEEEFFYRRENEPMVTEVVYFPATNFYATNPPSEAELQDYFTKHEAEYRLPDRVQINYVLFDPANSNYMAKGALALGTNVDEKAADYYHRQGPDAFKDESDQPLSEADAVTKIKKLMRQSAAYQEARKDANEFLSSLSVGHDEKHPYATSDLEKLAKARNLPFKTTEPFDEKNGSKDLPLPSKAMHLLFSLRTDEPDDAERAMIYPQSPLLGESNIYVAGLQMRFPSQLQTLATVRGEVSKDYRDSKAIALAKDAGEKFASAAQVALSQGKSFDAVCAAQNLKPVQLPPFALVSTNPPPGLDRTSFQHLLENVYPLPTEQSSRFIPTSDGGLVGYVKARLPVDEERMKQEFPTYLARRRAQLQIAAFSAWLSRQMQLRWIPPPGEQGGAG